MNGCPPRKYFTAENAAKIDTNTVVTILNPFPNPLKEISNIKKMHKTVNNIRYIVCGTLCIKRYMYSLKKYILYLQSLFRTMLNNSLVGMLYEIICFHELITILTHF